MATLFVEAGVSKLRVTGGEPLLRKDLPTLVRMLRAIPGVVDLALTTNGLLLPQYAAALKDAGLDRVTISLDTLDDVVFRRMNGRGQSVRAVLDGIQAAEHVGLSPVKINAVIQRGVNDQSVLELAAYFRGTGHVLRFIEFMDVGNCNGWRPSDVVPSREVRDWISAKYPLAPLEANYQGEVAERYRYADGMGEIGFISSVTQPFCGSCSRARLSADGYVYTCLFATQGVDFRTLLREGASNTTLAERLRMVWEGRRDRYSEIRSEAGITTSSTKKVEMYQIGG